MNASPESGFGIPQTPPEEKTRKVYRDNAAGIEEQQKDLNQEDLNAVLARLPSITDQMAAQAENDTQVSQLGTLDKEASLRLKKIDLLPEALKPIDKKQEDERRTRMALHRMSELLTKEDFIDLMAKIHEKELAEQKTETDVKGQADIIKKIKIRDEASDEAQKSLRKSFRERFRELEADKQREEGRLAYEKSERHEENKRTSVDMVEDPDWSIENARQAAAKKKGASEKPDTTKMTDDITEVNMADDITEEQKYTDDITKDENEKAA